MAKLYILATPIGNLSDISQRALNTLKRVDFVLCEDTRTTKKLLNHFKIETPTISYHQHSKLNKVNYILNLLQQGKDLALISDAGTPGVSDPGGKLIQAVLNPPLPISSPSLFARRSFSEGGEGRGRIKEGEGLVRVVPVPGPCALTTAASVSGFPMDKFLFLGFPPSKRKRNKFFQEVVNSKYPVILYESPHRILKTLNDLSVILSLAPRGVQGEESPQIVLCRELTKLHETIYRGAVQEIISQLKKEFPTTSPKGEFVIIVKNL